MSVSLTLKSPQRGEEVSFRWDHSLHNHFNQGEYSTACHHARCLTRTVAAKDGFGEDVFICCECRTEVCASLTANPARADAIMPLWDMDEKTGAT